MRSFEKLPVLKEPKSDVVAVSPPEREEFVPYAKPRTVGFAPPTLDMLPLIVAVVVAVPEMAVVVTRGGPFSSVGL